MTLSASFVLRDPSTLDFPFLAAMRRDQELRHALLSYPPARADTDEEVHAWVERRTAEPGGCFLVVDDGSGQAVGFVQIADAHVLGRHGKLGLALTQPVRGQGLGRGVLDRVKHYAKDTLGLTKLILEVSASNFSALGLYHSASFRKVGTLLAHYDDGHALHDVVVMECRLDQ